jgi:hypothetical protein
LLHDTEAKNEDGNSYLDKMLETLQNKDLQSVSSWLNSNQTSSTEEKIDRSEEEKVSSVIEEK